MATHSYKDLKVWQKGMDVVEKVYAIAAVLPTTEKYALADQMKRAAVSIPSNIAEGQKRFGKLEMSHFCSIALGSTAELETQLQLANRLYGLRADETLLIREDISKMLTGLIKALRSKN